MEWSSTEDINSRLVADMAIECIKEVRDDALRHMKDLSGIIDSQAMEICRLRDKLDKLKGTGCPACNSERNTGKPVAVMYHEC